ncbi:glutamate 5-kinase [Chitinophaga sp. YR627]|uniref:Glutamate 5-kinase n=1 Tax=Chitinophaga pinensis TaxID=79329 RepID=A0A5C6LXF8_9BACT|nr:MULTISPECIES: glutamate 5-kinase [Chitinophaga]TWW01943.1 glutamate 5-kinase [Chitinophaga pinensis]SFO96639.1 glutamate 5-kinase [Chitinophaga sp. YR627]
MTKPILVIKFGTASITHENGELDETIVASIARQVADLKDEYNIVLVSSGAVAAGKKYLKNYGGTMSERKAAAAIGNPLLLSKYARYFSPYDIAIAQSLCERRHFSNRAQFLQLKKTYEELWASGVIPVANENDVVSDLELKFSDNDELATLIAVGFGASMLLFSTSVGGVLDREGKVVPKIDAIDESILSLADTKKSNLGLGGMVSKLTFARLATRMGIKVVIFGIHTTDGILNAIAGNTGTLCLPQECSMPARKKWLASGSLVTGRVLVDEGALAALQKRRSLLAVGVLTVLERFEGGEVFEIVDEEHNVIAVARAKVSSDLLSDEGKVQNLEIAHADDIVLL